MSLLEPLHLGSPGLWSVGGLAVWAHCFQPVQDHAQEGDRTGPHLGRRHHEELNNAAALVDGHVSTMTIFAIGYLALYPGPGNGVAGFWAGPRWVSTRPSAPKLKLYQPLYDKFRRPGHQDGGRRQGSSGNGQAPNLLPHAVSRSDARGAKGFPNLTDNDWLYGGNPSRSPNPGGWPSRPDAGIWKAAGRRKGQGSWPTT